MAMRRLIDTHGDMRRRGGLVERVDRIPLLLIASVILALAGMSLKIPAGPADSASICRSPPTDARPLRTPFRSENGEVTDHVTSRLGVQSSHPSTRMS